MKRWMTVVVWYWIICCILAGAVEGHRFAKCPNDSQPDSLLEVVEMALIWPGVIGFAVTAPRPPYACTIH